MPYIQIAQKMPPILALFNVTLAALALYRSFEQLRCMCSDISGQAWRGVNGVSGFNAPMEPPLRIIGHLRDRQV